MEKLSSGYRINRAADDAAGLGISEKMRGQIGGLAQAQRNAQDGISLVQTAEGALTEVHSMLQRVRDLKVQYNNGTLDANDKTAIAAEVAEIAKEIGNIIDETKFNGKTAVRREHVHVPGRRQRRRDDLDRGREPRRRRPHRRRPLEPDRGSASAPQRRRDRRSAATCRDISDIDEMIENVSTARAAPTAPCRTASSTASPTWPPTRRT